jgi:hypothetical protein
MALSGVVVTVTGLVAKNDIPQNLGCILAGMGSNALFVGLHPFTVIKNIPLDLDIVVAARWMQILGCLLAVLIIFLFQAGGVRTLAGAEPNARKSSQHGDDFLLNKQIKVSYEHEKSDSICRTKCKYNQPVANYFSADWASASSSKSVTEALSDAVDSESRSSMGIWISSRTGCRRWNVSWIGLPNALVIRPVLGSGVPGRFQLGVRISSAGSVV